MAGNIKNIERKSWLSQQRQSFGPDWTTRINPVNLYIYTNDVSFLNEFNLAKIKKDLYLLNINPIDIEKLLKKSHK